MRRLTFALLVLSFAVTPAAAGPGDPFGGDDAGCIPPTANDAACEDGVAKAIRKYMQPVIKCHIKAADQGLKGNPFDEELCESDPTTGKGAKEKYDAAIAKLALSCPQCSTLNAALLRASTETNLE